MSVYISRVCLHYISDILIAVALLDLKVPISLKPDWIQLFVTVGWLIIIATIMFNCISSIKNKRSMLRIQSTMAHEQRVVCLWRE